jgi:hypothetical protein
MPWSEEASLFFLCGGGGGGANGGFFFQAMFDDNRCTYVLLKDLPFLTYIVGPRGRLSILQ